TSLCSSIEGRSLCDTIERRLGLTMVDRTTFPARPSNDGLPYDRDSVETFIARVEQFDGQPKPEGQRAFETAARTRPPQAERKPDPLGLRRRHSAVSKPVLSCVEGPRFSTGLRPPECGNLRS